MTLSEDLPHRAVLVAIDVAKHRNDLLGLVPLPRHGSSFSAQPILQMDPLKGDRPNRHPIDLL